MKKFGLTKIFLLTIILLVQLCSIKNNLIGIDLGTEFIKATMLRPGRPFTMVENIQSKTKTPAAVAFKDDERVFGADAMAKKPRIPKQVLVFFHQYLGKKYHSEEIKTFLEKFFVSYHIQEDVERGTMDIRIDFNRQEFKFSIEEVYGMIFRYIKYLTDKFSQSDIKDCVVTVPSFFGYKERQALAQAVEMSKLNLLGFVSENVAAAVHFSQNKNFNQTENYIFYNMGASYTQATLVSFVSNMQTKNNKTVEVSKTLTVLGETWDKDLGGNEFNYNLVRHLMQKFDETPQRKNKKSVKNDYKVVERILPSAIKYKEIISANKDVPVTVLGVESGMNLETRLTRDEFESINAKSLERVYHPIEKLLNLTGVDLSQINQIELLGGSVRVPKVQDGLKAKLGEHNNLIGMHMNGDDSMAFGAAYICANFSSNFKGGKTELYHGPNYEVKLKIKHLEREGTPYCEETSHNSTTTNNSSELSDHCVRKLDKNTTLYKLRRAFDQSKKVAFKHDGDLQVSLYEKFEEAVEENLLMTFNITGMEKVVGMMKKENLKTLPKVHLKFTQDAKGLVSLKAEATFELILYLHLQTGPNGGSEVLYLSNYTAPLSEEEIKRFEEEPKEQNLTETGRNTLISMRKDVGKKKVREEKFDLKVDVTYSSPRPLTKEEIKVSKEKLDKLDEIDTNRIKTMEKRNQLESLIYNKKDWLESSNAAVFSKEGELEAAQEGLNLIADWYEEDGYSAELPALSEKFNTLIDKFRPFDTRIIKYHQREKALENFHSEMKKVREDADALIKSKPWMEPHYNNSFIKEVNLVHEWLNENKEKQDKLAHHEDPVLHSEHIDAKIEIIKREYYAMARIPKPKNSTNQGNIKIEDLMKNKTNLEDLIRKANLTAADFEEINKREFSGDETEKNEEHTEKSQDDQDTSKDQTFNSETSDEVKKPDL